MKFLGITLLLAAVAHSLSADTALANRWYRNLYSVGGSYWAATDAGLTASEDLAAQASRHGYNGVVVPIHYFLMGWNDATKNRFKAFVSFCRDSGPEVVPEMFPINSGGMLFDRNFAEAVPIDRLPLTAAGGALLPAPDTTNLAVNGDFESHTGDTFTGYAFIDKPGTVSFADPAVRYGGGAAVRLENFSANSGMGRICQEITLKPNFQYKFRFMLKKDACANAVTVLVQGKAAGNEIQRFATPGNSPTVDWTQYEFEFTTSDISDIRYYIGIWGGSSGKIYIDNLEIAESGSLARIVRRTGAPLSVTSADGLVIYAENTDFSAITNSDSLASVRLPSGSRIADGQTVLLSCYRVSEYNGTRALCMSCDSVYSELSRQARALHAIYPYKRMFMYIDEIRSAGSCQACRSSGRTAAQILGGCVTRLYDTLRVIDPAVKVLTWADMLDPSWNAKNHYYKVYGDLTGSDNYIPKDITVVPWGDCKSASSQTQIAGSLAHFTQGGFEVMGCGYYDTGDLTGTTNWIQRLLNCQNARGLIYSTWVFPPDFSQLSGFGDLILQNLGTGISGPAAAVENPEPRFAVSPNPFTAGLRICFGKDIKPFAVRIFSVNGREMAVLPVDRSSELQWSLPDLPAGTYIIQAKTRHGAFRKIVSLVR